MLTRHPSRSPGSRRWGRRVASLAGLVSFLVVVAGLPAFACDPDVSGTREAERATQHALGAAQAVLPSASLGTANLQANAAGAAPTVMEFPKGMTLTRNPDDGSAAAFETPDQACEMPSCVDMTVVVPANSKGTTLYARAAWLKNTQYVHVWGVEPDGTTYVGSSNTADTFDKTTGNADVAPLAEFSVADPTPGTWHVQVRAVFGYQIPITGGVVLTTGSPLGLPKMDVTALADAYLTQNITYNIVFANRTFTAAELATFKAAMPTTYRVGVLEKQFPDGCGNETGEETLLDWGQTHFCGTAGGGNTGAVPAFEPLKLNIHYRYLQADATWTGDLFAAMQAATTQDHQFPTSHGTTVSRQPNTEGNYLADYNTQEGTTSRVAGAGAGAVVADATKGDVIDAFSVEDWIFNHRNDAKYSESFKDIDTGELHSGAFYSPDPASYFDPFYTAKGAKDLETMPQGPTTSWSYLIMDTFNGELAQKYFRPNAYHFFDVSTHEIDPDLNEEAGPDFMRMWGGRYRFFMEDLGAGPNWYEAQDTVLTKVVAGSALYPNGDPPVWDYDNDAKWSGMLPSRTARDAALVLFSRLAGTYLYRPVPADVYLLANSNWEDCDSNPQCSAEGVSYTDMSKIYHPSYVTHNLSAALPGVTFKDETSFGGSTFRYLSCSTDRQVANPSATVTGETMTLPQPLGSTVTTTAQQGVLVTNPQCTGKPSDPLEELLQTARARGDEVVGAGVEDAAASPAVVRAYVEAHRDGIPGQTVETGAIAPQPAGQFTITNISVVFPGATTWDLPALVGGIAYGTPNGEAWGVLNNVNDRFKTALATDCSKSNPAAPGCTTGDTCSGGVPCTGTPPISAGAGFSYTIEHESSHFLGLAHPHDYFAVEENKDGTGDDYYSEGFSDLGDFSMAPTTYAGAFSPYSVLDQDQIQRGHAAEYLRSEQDYLNDDYVQDGMAGLTSPSAATLQKVAQAQMWQKMASKLDSCGDYLHSERAMRNANLAAQGTFGPIVAPRQLQPGEQVLFQVNPQTVYTPDGEVDPNCIVPASTKTAPVVVSATGTSAATAPTTVGSLASTGLGTGVPVGAGAMLLGAAAVRRRRRRA